MKILVVDIETSPHEGFFWNPWNTTIRENQLIAPTGMMCWSAKFVGGSAVYFRTWHDKDFLDVLQNLMLQSDAVVTYNGDNFDLKHIRRELLEAGMPPPRPLASIDLIKPVRKNFKFPYNTLDYVCRTLLGIRKLDTGGFDLWPSFIDGDSKAIKLMKRYNIRDVRMTEKLYKFLRPWIKNHPNLCGADVDDEGVVYKCPTCQSTKTEKHRPRYTRCYAIRLVRCSSCGSWHDGKRSKIT